MSAQPSLTGNRMVMSNPFEPVKQNADRNGSKGGVKMTTGTGQKIRWTDDEWRAVVASALPHLKHGAEMLDALHKGQKVLPRERQRGTSQMDMLVKRERLGNGVISRYVQEMRKRLSYPEAAPPAPPPPAPIAPPKLRTSIDVDVMNGDSRYWSPIEWARIAREVKRMQDAGDDRSNFGRLMFDAQKVVLAQRRWRPLTGLLHANQKNGNQIRLAEAWKNVSLLADDPAPAAQPEQVIEMVTHAETRQEAPKPQGAPTPLQLPLSTFAGAMQAFASTFETALDTLLKDHEAHIVATMDQRLHSAADQIADVVAAQIREGLRRTVIATMAEELGGPVSPPPAPSIPPAPSTPPAPSAPPTASPSGTGLMGKHYAMWGPGELAAARAAAVPVTYVGRPRTEPTPEEYAPDEPGSDGKVKIDVVGMVGVQVTEIKKAFNGHTSLRFVDASQVTAWIPRRNCNVVLATKFISHNVPLKCARYHLKPIYANGGVASVIQAIKTIHEMEGIPQ